MTQTSIHDAHIINEPSIGHDRRGYDLDSMPKSPRQRVLIVDDDSDFVDMTKLILCNAGYDVAGALSGQAAINKCPEVDPDLILLDLMMPELDGYETFSHLQKITKAPVIVVTAIGDRENAARSFKAGMEDYIAKPFNKSEMIARIQAAIRRSQKPNFASQLYFPDMDMRIDHETNEVLIRGKFVWFAPREFKVLSILAKQAPKPVKYAAITQTIWGEANTQNRTHLKNIVFRLRQKIEQEPIHPKFIINLRNLGYQLNSNPGEKEITTSFAQYEHDLKGERK